MMRTQAQEDPVGWRREAAWLYVAGLLTPEERARFERLIKQGDAEATAEFALAQEAEARLLGAAARGVEPPAGAREGALSAAGAAVPVGERAGSVVSFAEGAQWRPGRAAGVWSRVLYEAPGGRKTALVRLEAGARLSAHTHGAEEECLVLEGDLCFADGTRYGPGDYQRHPANTRHPEAWSERGCLCLVTHGAG
jgi:quercetin dioxygenase-like cupin family protein